MLRSHIVESTAIGKEAAGHIHAGRLVPDAVILQMVEETLHAHERQSVLLDGFPRTLLQAERLSEFFSIDQVIALQVSHEVIKERMANRWIHMPSGRTYSYDYNPPKVKGDDLSFALYNIISLYFTLLRQLTPALLSLLLPPLQLLNVSSFFSFD